MKAAPRSLEEVLHAREAIELKNFVLHGHTGPILDGAVSPDGRLFLTVQ